jgi:hypothetical protein
MVQARELETGQARERGTEQEQARGQAMDVVSVSTAARGR